MEELNPRHEMPPRTVTRVWLAITRVMSDVLEQPHRAVIHGTVSAIHSLITLDRLTSGVGAETATAWGGLQHAGTTLPDRPPARVATPGSMSPL